MSTDEIRVVLLGKTGAGKSSLGNNLLMKNTFKAAMGTSSVTSKCESDHRRLDDGSSLLVVDTPGLFDTHNTIQKTSEEICRCLTLSAPGPHAFIFVIRVGRFTLEEAETIALLCDIFGESVLKHVMVVFTAKDALDYDNKSVTDYVEEAPMSLKKVIEDCGRRYAAVFNRAKNKEKEIEPVMNTLRETIEQEGCHYTGEMYREAERALNRRIQRIEAEKKRKEEELQRKKEDLEKRERQAKKEAMRQIKDLERQIEAVRSRDSRHDARKEVQENPTVDITDIDKVRNVIASVAVHCSIM